MTTPDFDLTGSPAATWQAPPTPGVEPQPVAAGDTTRSAKFWAALDDGQAVCTCGQIASNHHNLGVCLDWCGCNKFTPQQGVTA